MRILVTANTTWNIVNFRLSLLERLLSQGHSVCIVAPEDRHSVVLKEKGYEVHKLNINNKSINPFRELVTLLHYYSLFSKIRPDVTINFTIKPIIYATLVSRFFGTKSINTFTGLGTGFLHGRRMKFVVAKLIQLVLKHGACNFVHNQDDLKELTELAPKSIQTIKEIGGSGIDLKYFTPRSFVKKNETVFLMISRLLRDKGVDEYFDAAETISQRYRNVQFLLVGPLDPKNRTGITKQELENRLDGGYVRYLGELADVRDQIARADCLVLPSYREGLPRVLLEGAAMGRSAIATDVPGCRKIVVNQKTGLLCQPRDSLALTEKIEEFLGWPLSKRAIIAQNAMEFARANFSLEGVIGAYMEEIKMLEVNFE